MIPKPAALLSLILALWGCAEGGIRGSGISTAVFGNVVRVQSGAQPAAAGRAAVQATDLEGIEVAIEGTNVEGKTDASGNFSIAGSFEGMVTLVFRLPDGDRQARIALNVPAAGRLTLNDVTIDAENEAAYAVRQDVEFGATITDVDCQTLFLTLVSSQRVPGDDDQYMMRLDNSEVRDSSGNLVPCPDLRRGDQAAVQGVVYPDGTFGEGTIDLED